MARHVPTRLENCGIGGAYDNEENEMNNKVYPTVSTLLVTLGCVVTFALGVYAQNMSQRDSPYTLILEEFNSSTVGTAHGIIYSTAVGDAGAVFSYRNDSRIEYSFNNRFPRQGTLEFLIKIHSGYHYDNYAFHSSDTTAQIFGTDIPGGDVYWPGGMTLRVTRNGIIYWSTETKYGQPVTHNAVAKVTRFRFGEWHTIGISYGSEGQYIMVDGSIVYSDPSFTMIMGSAGNFKSPVDVPAIGQNVSGFWAYHRYDGGFNGIVGRFRASSAQRDWVISATPPLLSSLPPSLSANVSFSEPSGNNLLDADEQGKITVKVNNSGKGDAYGLSVKIEPSSYDGLSYSPTLDIGDIPAGGSKTIEIPVTALQDVSSGDVSLVLKFIEANGFEPPPTKIVFTTKAFVPPKLVVSDVGVEDAEGGSIIQPGKVVSITARIQNAGLGDARDVNASVRLGQNVFLAQDSKTTFQLGSLAPGQYKDIKFSLYTNNRATDVPVYVDLMEHYGSYGLSNYRLPLAFNRPMAKLNEIVVQPKEQLTPAIEISKGLSIDVDSNIPHAREGNPNAVALILAIISVQL
ncbi:MAG: hypothetical protein M1470_08950 [Bacteroidetes bacterium]|nr:hypothetical protein [Bacteroidota bacterium]